MEIDLLICDCGDCRHWEIAVDSIICKNCGKEFSTPGLRKFVQEHVELHPSLSWKKHEK